MVQCHKLKSKTRKKYVTMTKPTFIDEFKQRVVQYVLDNPDEPKVAVTKKFSIADSTVHKRLKNANNNDDIINSKGSGNYSSDEA